MKYRNPAADCEIPRKKNTGLISEPRDLPLRSQMRNGPRATYPPSHSQTQPVSERFPALEKQEVHLALDCPGAREVRAAGSFNGWRPDDTILKKSVDGGWLATMSLRSGRYEYLFVVDGKWMEDPCAPDHVANPFGGFNSILLVPLAVRTSIL